MHINTMERLNRARVAMERNSDLPSDLVSPEIFASWTRCLELVV